jgi:replicative DNA helicase
VSLPPAAWQQQLDADEATLLGLAFYPTMIDDLMESLRLVRPADFTSSGRELVWRVVEAHATNNEPLDIAAMHSALGAAASGAKLRMCMDIVTRECLTPPAPGWAPLAAERVAKAAKLRRVGALGQRLQQLADVGDLDAFDTVMEHAEETWRAIQNDAVVVDDAPRVPDFVDAYLGELAGGPQYQVVPTPWAELNSIFTAGGLRPGGFYVFGARPGVGKTLAGGRVAWVAAESGYNTLVVSAEMHRFELMDRWMAASMREELSEFTSYAPSERVLAAAQAHATWVKQVDLPLWVLDSPNITMARIVAQARQLHRRHGLHLVVIDYLQLIKTAAGSNRQEQVALMSGICKQLAKELHLPVVALAQLNRGGADAPQLHHFRETGSIEQDADGVILLHLPTITEELPEGGTISYPSGTVQFIIAKNRHGRTGTIELDYKPHWGDIADRA